MLVLLVGDPFMAHVLRYSVQGCCKVYRVCLGQVMVAMHRGRVMDEGVSQYRVLLIDDDESLTHLLADELAREGFAVERCDCGEEGLDALAGREFQLVVLDMMLPGLPGEQVLERIRQMSDVPVLILTARDEHDLLVRMLRAGADDYLMKPFYPDEFLARVFALVRRYAGGRLPKGAVRAHERSADADIVIDPARRFVTVRGAELVLTRRELDVLIALASHLGVVRTKSQLLDAVWGDEAQVDGEVVTVAVSRLRRALAGAGVPDAIETLRGIGYRFARTASVAVLPSGEGRGR